MGRRRGCSSEWSARGILRLAVIDMLAVLMGQTGWWLDRCIFGCHGAVSDGRVDVPVCLLDGLGAGAGREAAQDQYGPAAGASPTEGSADRGLRRAASLQARIANLNRPGVSGDLVI